ncbi:phosphohistidine phosphatase SixA [Candidatus Omnitrophota bacterium]
MKTIYLVQHGIAQVEEVDPKRALSDVGIEEVRRVAAYLKKHDVVFSRIVHSGKLRALQTAEIFAEILDVEDVCALEGINPKDDPDIFMRQLTDDHLMVVGHLPHLQKVASKIVANDENRAVVKIQNASVLCLEIENHVGSIQWFVVPGMC